MAEIKQVTGLMPTEYEHPLDRKALDALSATPGMDVLVKLFYKYYFERVLTIEYTGSHVLITPEAYPDLYGLFDKACDTINMPGRPLLYIQQDPTINAFSQGVEQPFVSLTYRTVDLMTDEELTCVMAHEIGHHKSQHILYRTIALFWGELAALAAGMTMGASELVAEPLKYALLFWSRMSEFTADRAGLLACQDINVAASVMCKIAGMPEKYYGDIKLEAFLDQARAFKGYDYSDLNKFYRFLATASMDHPWTVIRTAELLKWIESGDYQRVLDRQTAQPSEAVFAASASGVVGLTCRNCATPLVGNEAFCPHCGQSVGAAPVVLHGQEINHSGTRQVH